MPRHPLGVPLQELLMAALAADRVPDSWAAVGYPSLRPLGSWVANLLQRARGAWGLGRGGAGAALCAGGRRPGLGARSSVPPARLSAPTRCALPLLPPGASPLPPPAGGADPGVVHRPGAAQERVAQRVRPLVAGRRALRAAPGQPSNDPRRAARVPPPSLPLAACSTPSRSSPPSSRPRRGATSGRWTRPSSSWRRACKGAGDAEGSGWVRRPALPV